MQLGLLAQKFFLAGSQSQQDTPTAETGGKTTSHVTAGSDVKSRHLCSPLNLRLCSPLCLAAATAEAGACVACGCLLVPAWFSKVVTPQLRIQTEENTWKARCLPTHMGQLRLCHAQVG